MRSEQFEILPICRRHLCIFRHRSRSYEAVEARATPPSSLVEKVGGPRGLLRSEQAPAAFAPVCSQPAGPGQAAWLLWGDSHAAALLPGLLALRPANELQPSLSQFTAAACPPGWRTAARDNAACAAVNAHAQAQVLALRPHTVVLAANWGAESIEALPSARPRSQVLRDTVAWLREAGVQRVVVVGPLVQWRREPPRLILDDWQQHARVTESTFEGIDAAVGALDDAVGAEAQAAGALYLSPVQASCGVAGCRLSVPAATGSQAIAFDSSHLTVEGSKWLVQALGFASLAGPTR